MESRIILLDTSILIDFYRKKDKSASAFIQIYNKQTQFVISAITHYEIYIGTSPDQVVFWNTFFSGITILPVDTEVSKTAVDIYSDLKKKSSLIDIADLLIAATAITHNYPCATLNKKHFARVDGLSIID
jgi:predicted nucleic acid-binding protein